MTMTVKTTTATDAPVEISSIMAICAAPDRTNTDKPSASRAESPLPTAIAPRAIAKGIRPNEADAVAFTPEMNADEEDATFGFSSSMILGGQERCFWSGSHRLPEAYASRRFWSNPLLEHSSTFVDDFVCRVWYW
jgi:hypothetical protein